MRYSAHSLYQQIILRYERDSFEPKRQETYPRTCAPSEDSNQPAHSRSLIRIFSGRIFDLQGCNASSCGQRRLWSDCADAHADLNLRWANIWEWTFSHVVAHFTCIAVFHWILRYYLYEPGNHSYSDNTNKAPYICTPHYVLRLKYNNAIMTAAWREMATVLFPSTGTDRPAQTADPDQILQNAASDLGLHCLSVLQQFVDALTVI